jgi:hypothetical protein
MKCTNITGIMLGGLLILLLFAQAHAQTDPLPSWNDGPASSPTSPCRKC